jgi:hypothetical protein
MTILYTEIIRDRLMITLIDFIRNVEDEVFEEVQNFSRNQKEVSASTSIWVHQLEGKVFFGEAPLKPGYVHQPVYKLCDMDKDLRWIPDKKAIKKWIEGEVLMHPATVRKRRVASP